MPQEFSFAADCGVRGEGDEGKEGWDWWFGKGFRKG